MTLSREPLFGIVHTADGLAVVPAAEVPRRTALMKRKHADELLVKYLADPAPLPADAVEIDFGPGDRAF